MRWPWSRHQIQIDPEAHAAMDRAEERYAAQQARDPEVDLVAARLIERRQRNRFAELVEEALQARKEQT
jgi:hypothetical protein